MQPRLNTQNVLQNVRAKFIAEGTTLSQWCKANGIDSARAWRVLQGNATGKKALQLRGTILAAAGIADNDA